MKVLARGDFKYYSDEIPIQYAEYIGISCNIRGELVSNFFLDETSAKHLPIHPFRGVKHTETEFG